MPPPTSPADSLVEAHLSNLALGLDTPHLSSIANIHAALFARTKTFITSVHDLAAATALQAPHRWSEPACLLVEYAVNVLRAERLGAEKFLPSQRAGLYWMLDDALLRVCLAAWERPDGAVRWERDARPLRQALEQAEKFVPAWKARDEAWAAIGAQPGESVGAGLRVPFFERASGFLEASGRMCEVRRAVWVGGKGRLPRGVREGIVRDVRESEGRPVGELRTVYFPAGKK
jgi:hypothetical protein